MQSIVIGLLAAIVSLAISWTIEGRFNIQHAIVLCSASVLTASLGSLALGLCVCIDFDTEIYENKNRKKKNSYFCFSFVGLIMIVVIVLSYKCKINPDNVATPTAASLGDLTTLLILASISAFSFHIIGM